MHNVWKSLCKTPACHLGYLYHVLQYTVQITIIKPELQILARKKILACASSCKTKQAFGISCSSWNKQETQSEREKIWEFDKGKYCNRPPPTHTLIGNR